MAALGRDRLGGADRGSRTGGLRVREDDYFESFFPGVPEGDLASCEVGQEPPGVEASDLEAELKPVLSGIDVECIHRSMLLRPAPQPSIFYGICEGEPGQESIRKVKPPCLSKAYVHHVHEAYVRALDCANVDPRELFGLITVESAFQVNVGNRAGAWGAAQLIPVAMAAIDRQRGFEGLKSRPECSGFAPLFQASEERASATAQARASRTSPCGRIRVPEHPAGSFLYGAVAYLRFRAVAEQELARSKLRFDSPAARSKIVREIALAMYNGGDGGVAPALRAFLVAQGGRRIGLKAFRSEFRDYLQKHYGEGLSLFGGKSDVLERKRKEVSGYAASIAGVEGAISRQSGKACAL